MIRRFLVFLIGWFAFGISFAQTKSETPYVIMISFDGFRHDYVEKYNPPNLNTFIKNGSQAEALIPSFPSKTFPNHYTLVTGLTPGHHGLVDNSFYDRKRKQVYGMRDRKVVEDPYYYGGVPLWQLARENGIKSASFFWVGSELNIESKRPDYYFPFDDTVLPQKRVDQVISWLKLPEKERPHMITLYFSFPDHEGHSFGPNSEEVRGAVFRADSLLGNLMNQLKSVNLPVNVIIVSDHGMHELTVQKETYIFIEELINRKDSSVVVVNGGTHVGLYFKNAHKKDSVYQYLKTKESGFKVYKKEDFPERWHYKVDRVGDLLLEVDGNHYFRESGWANMLRSAKIGSAFGVHGYDPDMMKDVRGIFYANGPNIKTGVIIPAFQNIHVYPLVAKILRLPLPVIDGKEEVLLLIYKKK
ncbi:MAG: alkaline phosphatase family protein [Cyclobacteriaceae bacterium]|nr:alkaline phosphatase family protein [Cyclobacteriaceae bacterium]